MKKIKLISSVLAAAMTMQCAAFSVFAEGSSSAPTLVASDTAIQWNMDWSASRSEKAYDYYTDWSLENGLTITHHGSKYTEFKNNYAVINTARYYEDADGNFVSKDTTGAIEKKWAWDQGQLSTRAYININETEASTEPLVVSYTYKSTNSAGASWDGAWDSGSELSVGDDFKLIFNHDGKGLALKCYDGSDMVKKTLGIKRDDNYHDVKFVISPNLTTDGRYQMVAISVDGTVTELENAYGMKSGRTDTLLTKLSYLSGCNNGNDFTDEIKNLNVYRGLEALTVSTDFVDGSELTADGIDIAASEILAKDTFDIKVYDCDFDDELISDPGMITTCIGKSINVKFTKLEAGGSYRMELIGVKDIWGNTYDDTLSVSFKTPEEESGSIDDTPNNEGSGDEIETGTISKTTSELYHGHAFHEVAQTENEYSVIIDTPAWWAAEQKRYAKNSYFWYDDEDGTPIKLGYGNDAWDQVPVTINLGETTNPKKTLVVSFDYYCENTGSVSEWNSYYINVNGIYCFIPGNTETSGLLKFYQDGNTVTKKTTIKPTEDGYHNYTIVFAPELVEGRAQVTAIGIDGEYTFYDDVYTLTNTFTDETFVMKNIIVQVPRAEEGRADLGKATVKVRNLKAERVDGLEAEMFMPLGKQNPKEDIKLNFNYPIPDKLTADDFAIYEISENDGETIETKIPNTLTVSKAYDNKQLVIGVGDGGLYYNKKYKLVINKTITVNTYIGLSKKSYELTTIEYPDDLSVDLTKSGSSVGYSISGGGDSFVIMAATYDKDGSLIGLNRVLAEKTGSGSRRKAKGTISAENTSADTTVNLYIFTADGKMTLYRMPSEL